MSLSGCCLCAPEQFVHLFVLVLWLTETFNLTNVHVYFAKSICVEEKMQSWKKATTITRGTSAHTHNHKPISPAHVAIMIILPFKGQVVVKSVCKNNITWRTIRCCLVGFFRLGVHECWITKENMLHFATIRLTLNVKCCKLHVDDQLFNRWSTNRRETT